jgi:hypothetical protein
MQISPSYDLDILECTQLVGVSACLSEESLPKHAQYFLQPRNFYFIGLEFIS